MCCYPLPCAYDLVSGTWACALDSPLLLLTQLGHLCTLCLLQTILLDLLRTPTTAQVLPYAAMHHATCCTIVTPAPT